jgi:hypothetical protein
MLLARYVLSVGGVLLALLFVADAVAPKVPAAATDSNLGMDKAVIRIHTDRKWPEPVVFDTNIPTTIVPTQTIKAEAVVPPPAPVADVSAKTRVRESFAQFVAPEPKKPEAKPQRKRKIARSRVAPPMIQVAQQPRFGFFNTW